MLHRFRKGAEHGANERGRGPSAAPLLALASASALTLAGCSTPPPVERPAIPTWSAPSGVPGESGPSDSPDAFGPSSDIGETESRKTALDPVTAAPASSFALGLEELVNRALNANRGLLDARDGVTSADYALRASEFEFELRIFPTATANTVSGNQQSTIDSYGFGVDLRQRFATGTNVSVGPAVRKLGDNYISEVRASLRQPLLRGRQPELVLSPVDAARFAATTSRRFLHQAQVDTILATVTAAYQVVRQRQFLRLSEESVDRLEGHAAAARARERAGIASSLDVFRATFQLGRARDNLDSAQAAYGDALDALRLLLALDLEAAVDVDAPLTFDVVRLSEEDAVAQALALRVELDQARHAVLESERRSRVARHATEPDLDLVLSFRQFGTSPNLSDSTSLDDNALSLSLATTSDIYRINERARYGQTLLDVNAARRSLDFLRDGIVRDVRRELRNLNRAEQRIDLQQDQIQRSEGKLALARAKFNRGLSSNFDVIEAEDELRTAETTLVSAVIDYVVGTYRLRAALGTLLERPASLALTADLTAGRGS